MDDCDVPPLEDFTEIIEIKKKLHQEKLSEPIQVEVETHIESKIQSSSTENATKQNETSKSSQMVASDKSFGGMKRGFLSASKSPGETSVQKGSEPLPFIKPREQADDKLRFQEVQNAVKNNTEWVTDGLLEQIAGQGDLMRWLSDPRTAHLLTEFQENPTQAMQKYAHDGRVIELFKQFAGILGSHFSSLSETQDKQQQRAQQVQVVSREPGVGSDIRPAVDAQVEEIVSDPAIQEAMTDPRVVRIIQALQSCPPEGQRLAMEADPEVRGKIKILIDAGVLAVQR